MLGAVFDGDSAGPGPDDPQLRNRYGVNFRINDPPLVLSEAQFLWNAKKGDPGLDGKFKLGAWRHFGLFNDQRFDGAGVSLANTASNGMPGLLRGDFGLYAVAEQKIYRVGGDDERGIGVFARASYSPPDRKTLSTIMQTPGSNSSALRMGGPRTSLVLPPPTRASRRGPVRLILTFKDLRCPGGPRAALKVF